MCCRNNDITDALELTFATDDERFGETVSIELKPGGEEIEVTNENKHEYVE
jgi:E3 ubiquitin-protein ligase NEDD4